MKLELTKSQHAKLVHMLGADPRRFRPSQRGFRNHFAACPGGAAERELRDLEAAGLVVQGHASPNMVYFHATAEGCKAVGLNDKQMQRALDDDA